MGCRLVCSNVGDRTAATAAMLMREQTVANHHHLCEATREEMGGRRETKEKKTKKISIRRELRDVDSQESSRKIRTGKHNQKIRTATVPVRRESRSSADLNLSTMHDSVTSLLVTITWGKKRELQIWSLRDCLDYIVSLKKSCNQSAKLLFLILNSYSPHPFDMAWKTESPYFQLLQVSLCILEFWGSKQI